MSATVASTPTRTERPQSRQQPRHVAPVVPPPRTSTPRPSARHERGGRVLFEVPFTSEMTDADLARLAQPLDLSAHMYPKLRPDANSPGVVRLDHFSGLFLERGDSAGQWALEARTWGDPAAETVHEWHLLAIDAARVLDPSVKRPDRLPAPAVQIADRPVGEVLNRRFAAFRRHLVGLP